MNNEFIIKRGMIFYADLGISEDSVQAGLRPVISWEMAYNANSGQL